MFIVQFNSIMINLAEGEVIHSMIEPYEGIFVIISGLIQVTICLLVIQDALMNTC